MHQHNAFRVKDLHLVSKYRQFQHPRCGFENKPEDTSETSSYILSVPKLIQEIIQLFFFFFLNSFQFKNQHL